MAQDPDDWINNPAFRWTPEVPLRIEPQLSSSLLAEPRAAEPRIENPPVQEPAGKTTASPQPLTPRETAFAGKFDHSTSLFVPRMAIGLMQGIVLFALVTWQSALEPFFFSAALLMALFAPLIPLAGLGRMRLPVLLAWTGFAAVLLGAAGSYHHWRTLSSDGSHPGLSLLTLTGLFFFIAHSIAQSTPGDYASVQRSAWRLAIRIMLCALCAAFSWVAVGAAIGLVREHSPWIPFANLSVLFVALSTALGAQLTGEKLLAVFQECLLFVFTMALPLLLVLAVAVVGLGVLGPWRTTLAIPASLGFALIVAFNASYGDGTQGRPYWRRPAEFTASMLLLPLALLAANALAMRVQQYGWTGNRIFAAALILTLSSYAMCYAACAMISLGGGGWMQQIQTINLAMAFASLTLIAALASPIADPARLAVATQAARLERHEIEADAFDYLWLRDAGLRFGHETLARMAAQTGTPSVTQGAFAALTLPPQAARPTPTEIGANIYVRTPGRGLPTGLLSRDWTRVADAPPCLVGASLACEAFFIDLDSDGRDEIILAFGTDAHWSGVLMKQGVGGGWYVAGTLTVPPCPGSLAALRAGNFSTVSPAGNWRDLLVGGLRLKLTPPSLPSACPGL